VYIYIYKLVTSYPVINQFPKTLKPATATGVPSYSVVIISDFLVSPVIWLADVNGY
jgi:hypothetical protein